MTYQEIISKVSEELGIEETIVKSTYDEFWHFIRESIKELPLKDDISEEQFNTLNTNFNIPSLGKLNCTYDRLVRVKKRYEYINKIKDASNKGH